MTLTEEGGRTVLTLTMDYGCKTIRDQALASGMTGGMETRYARIDAIAAEAAA